MEKKQEKLKKRDERRCSNCGSLLTYVRVKDKEKVCRSCGYIEKLDKKEDGGTS